MRALPVREEEAELIAHYGVLPEDEFYDLPFEIRGEVLLVNTRRFTSLLGYWRDCRLPRCRRAKAGLGELRPPGRGGYPRQRPPCAHNNDERHDILLNGPEHYEEHLRRHALIGGSRLRDAENEENGA